MWLILEQAQAQNERAEPQAGMQTRIDRYRGQRRQIAFALVEDEPSDAGLGIPVDHGECGKVER